LVLADGGIVGAGAFYAEGQLGIPLGDNLNGVAPENPVEGFAPYLQAG
jgi:hypothetical protein